MADKPAIEENRIEELVFVLAGLIIFGVIVSRIFEYLDSLGGAELVWNNFLDALLPYWNIWKVIAVIICIICFFWFVYTYRKIGEVVKKEKAIFGPVQAEPASGESPGEAVGEKKNDKWERVKAHGLSDIPADWRLAIIEADIMLDEALRAAGYVGDGVGERLKTIDKSDLLTLENAWEAHKVRNRIAHSGGDFQLNERETKQVIALFESVFKELKAI